jgi:signal transduction histidine kinase
MRASSADEPELHPFLAHFLHDAETFWSADREGRLKSDAWLETRDGGDDCFQAIAFVLSDRRAVLAIELLRDFGTERQAPLQAARESRLHFERLQKEIEKKEVLLSCIVHDLKGPLSGMLSVFALLKRERTEESTLELAELGVTQARKQESMIRTILDVFAAEVSALEEFERDPARAPDLLRAARNSVAMLGPAFAHKGVALALDVEGSAGSRSADESNGALPVFGHAQRLERVIANLLENALRVSASGSSVELVVRADASLARVAVDDRGPGVAESLREQLFERIAPDRERAGSGTAGLGLYFCRMNVERWGGRIGCEPRDGGGTRFWFELPRARADAPPASGSRESAE